MIGIQVNGEPFTDFISAQVTVDLKTMANDFSFTASAVSAFPPLREGDNAVVTVDGIKILTGFIGEVNGNDSEGGHTVSYTGRDKTGDFIDSTINTINDIKASESLTLKSIIESVIAHLGSDLAVEDLLNAAPFNAAEDIIAPRVGQKALEFITAYAQKRQALLSSNGDGNILIAQSSPVDSGAVLQRLQGANDNNILSQNWSITGSARFNKYIHRGQLKPGALNFGGDSDTNTVEDQGGEAIATGNRVGRQSVIVETDSYSSAQLKNRAKWSKQLAAAKATRYGCVVAGHQMPLGGIWAVNTLAQINSDVADINRKMLLETITFAQGEKKPTTTALGFVEKNVYTINERILAQRPTGSLNDAFKSLE